MSEIIYEETSKGNFEPKQRRARKIHSADKRKDRMATIVGVGIILAALALYVAAIWIGFGGGWRYL